MRKLLVLKKFKFDAKRSVKLDCILTSDVEYDDKRVENNEERVEDSDECLEDDEHLKDNDECMEYND